MKPKSLLLGQGELPASFLGELIPALRAGALVLFPTDTVYGVGADPLSRQGMDRLYRAKLRPALKPLPFLIESALEARRWAVWDAKAQRLADRFWPGPLTMVFPPTPEGKNIAGAPGIGLRVPRHKALLTVLRELGGPLASSSANKAGEPPALRAEEALHALGDVAEYVLVQERPLPGGASTVVDMTTNPLAVLRPGPISEDELRRALAPGPQ